MSACAVSAPAGLPVDPDHSSPCTIRPLDAADLDAVGALQEASIMAFGASAYGRDELEAWARLGWQYRHRLLTDPGAFFVAASGERVVGIGGWSPDSLAPADAWLRYLFVHPDQAGRGLGRMLAAAAEAAARTSGKSRFQVWSSLNAAGFYQALGYRHVRQGRLPVTGTIEMAFVLMVKETG
jgi:putative acetyltransferase